MPFLQHERTLATRFVRRAGALGGIGLARAASAGHPLDPENPSTFSVYASRSNLESGVAKFGVEVANALPAVEQYWRGTVALDAPAATRGEWQSAVAWIRDDRVVRVLVNVGDDAKLAELPATLTRVYGSPGRTRGAVTTWNLPGGLSATLGHRSDHLAHHRRLDGGPDASNCFADERRAFGYGRDPDWGRCSRRDDHMLHGPRRRAREREPRAA